MAAAAISSLATSRPQIVTAAPRAPKRVAVSNPIPVEPPTINAFFVTFGFIVQSLSRIPLQSTGQIRSDALRFHDKQWFRFEQAGTMRLGRHNQVSLDENA
jgi:hypothetical protein